jgi:hypothetical protein
MTVNGAVVEQIAFGALGSSEIELDSKVEYGHLVPPADFPVHLAVGDVTGVGGIVRGRL